MKRFLGVWLSMGVNRMRSTRDYWNVDTNVHQVSSVMTYNRFQSIKASLCFYDKCQEDKLDKADRYAKVRYLIQWMRVKCKQLPQENHFSLDEVMIPYKGKFAGNLKQ